MGRARLTTFALTLFATGCSVIVDDKLDEKGDAPADGGISTPDGSPGGDGGTVQVDCSMENDGTSCGSGLICIDRVCVPSQCGDGFTDAVSGEECDDGNEVSGDGCEPVTCEHTCEADADCDDGQPCNGSETCDTDAHTCQPGTDLPDPGTPCTRMLDDGSEAEGACGGGFCVAPGCGNGVVDEGEDCDDGMDGDNLDGCRDDCAFTCSGDLDCDDGDACNGTEACDTETHTCTDPEPLDCDDADDCTEDGCDPEMGCVHELIDGDGDDFADESLGDCPTMPDAAGDCDDDNAAVYPGATEYCDELDNDCDGTKDEDAVEATCYEDADGDGYGNEAVTMNACKCPEGWVAPRSDGIFDCYDSPTDGAAVNPGQTRYFTEPYGRGSFDYNCDERSEQQYTTFHSGCSGGLTRVCSGSGWKPPDDGTRPVPPACGSTAIWVTCGGRLVGECNPSEEKRVQPCR